MNTSSVVFNEQSYGDSTNDQNSGFHAIKDKVAVITGAAGGIGQALALEMARRGARGLALVDFNERVADVAREVNAFAEREVAFPCRGDTSDASFRQKVYADITEKAGVPRICVPAAAITKDSKPMGTE